MGKNNKKRTIWTSPMEKLLIHLWQARASNLRKGRWRNECIEMAQQINEAFVSSQVTPENVKIKINHLKTKYKRIKCNSRLTWEHYSAIDRIIGAPLDSQSNDMSVTEEKEQSDGEVDLSEVQFVPIHSHSLDSSVSSQTPSVPSQTPFVSNQTQSVLNQTQSVPRQTQSLINQTLSLFNQTLSAFNQTLSVLNQTPSVLNQTPSVPNQTPSVPNQTPSVPNQTPFVSSQTTPVIPSPIHGRSKEEQLSIIADSFKTIAEEMTQQTKDRQMHARQILAQTDTINRTFKKYVSKINSLTKKK